MEDKKMKTKALLLLCAILALAACSNEDNDTAQTPMTPTELTQQTITFNLTATHPNDNAAASRGWTGDGQTATTRAVKQTWEAGDAIFVFFCDVAAAPRHLKMTFDGSAWTSAEYDGATQNAGALGLHDGDAGTMRAIYLPFGSNVTIGNEGDRFTFSKDYFAYYLTATLAYTVTNNEVSGAFDMQIPADYVQFFVEDADAADEAYTLSSDAVIPTSLYNIEADGSIVERSENAGDAMPGYKYSGGYLFSGKLNPSYPATVALLPTYERSDVVIGYYFIKNNSSGNERRDYLVTGKTLVSHSAVKLPANGDSKWLQVGSDKYVELLKSDNSSLGTWCTCNYGATLPEQVGTQLYFYDAWKQGIPSKYQFNAIVENCQWAWMTVNGQAGMGIKAATGFLFLPAKDDTSGYYWSSTADGSPSGDSLPYAWRLFFKIQGNDHSVVYLSNWNINCEVRPILNRGLNALDDYNDSGDPFGF